MICYKIRKDKKRKEEKRKISKIVGTYVYARAAQALHLDQKTKMERNVQKKFRELQKKAKDPNSLKGVPSPNFLYFENAS
jgi:hypothetical protein